MEKEGEQKKRRTSQCGFDTNEWLFAGLSDILSKPEDCWHIQRTTSMCDTGVWIPLRRKKLASMFNAECVQDDLAKFVSDAKQYITRPVPIGQWHISCYWKAQ